MRLSFRTLGTGLLSLTIGAGLSLPVNAAALPFPSEIAAPVTRTDADPVVLVAQTTPEAAALLLRIQELEEQVRLMTGTVEGLQFQITQMQTLLERLTAPGATPPAATAPAAAETPASPDQSLAIPEGGVVPVPGEIEIDPTFSGPLDDVPAVETLGNGTAQPLDLSLPTTATNPDAAAQFTAAYDALVRADYGVAEDQFGQFVALYPDDPQAPDAYNWLGEAMIMQGSYEAAAETLLTGYQTYPESPRAQDMLLKLGVALSGAGEAPTACRTFAEVEKRYPQMAPAFRQRLDDEKSKAQCPAG